MIGEGTIIEKGAVVGENPIFGYRCIIRDGATIGNHVFISHYSIIARGTTVEDDVFIGPGVVTTNTRKICHGRNPEHTGQSTPITIKRGARIGGGVTILPGVVIGEECLIGAGSVVTKSTEPYSIYYGNPAKYKGPVPENEWLEKNKEKKWQPI